MYKRKNLYTKYFIRKQWYKIFYTVLNATAVALSLRYLSYYIKGLTCGYRRHLKKSLINTFITNENPIYVKYPALEINIQLLDKFSNLSNVTQVLKKGQMSISTKISFLNNFRKNEANKILSFSASYFSGWSYFIQLPFWVIPPSFRLVGNNV